MILCLVILARQFQPKNFVKVNSNVHLEIYSILLWQAIAAIFLTMFAQQTDNLLRLALIRLIFQLLTIANHMTMWKDRCVKMLMVASFSNNAMKGKEYDTSVGSRPEKPESPNFGTQAR